MRTPTRGKYWLIRPQLWLAVITVALAAPGLIVNMIDADHRESGGRLMPELMRIADISVLAVVVAFLAAIALGVWKGRERLAGRRTRFKVAYWVLGLGAQLVISVGLAFTMVLSNFHLFDGQYLGVKARSPAGDRTAYLYSQGLFCGYEVFIRRDGETRLTEQYAFNTDCDDRPARPRLVWTDDGQGVAVTGPDGTPVPSKTIHFFSPHH